MYVQYKSVFINHFYKGIYFCIENKKAKFLLFLYRKNPLLKPNVCIMQSRLLHKKQFQLQCRFYYTFILLFNVGIAPIYSNIFYF
jgi:hypothetical protein